MSGRPLKYNDVEELNKLIDDYFESLVEFRYYKVPKRDEDDKKILGEFEFKPELAPNGDHVKDFSETPSITGLALFLNTSRKTLMQYERLENEELSNAIKRAKDMIEYYTENSNEAPAVKIFKLKNFDWTDKQEVESINVNHNINEEVKTPEERKARIKELLDKNKNG